MVLTALTTTAHEEQPARPSRLLRYTQLHKLVDQLTAAAEREDHGELTRVADDYCAMAVRYARGRVRVSRSLFLPTVFAVLQRIEKKYPLRTDAREQLSDEMIEGLESASTVDALVKSFKTALQRLSAIGGAAQGPKLARIQAIMNYTRRHLAMRLRLPDVARKAGFSVPAFVRAFKETTGTSYGPFLRGLRIELAKRLLADGRTVDEAAAGSGFETQHNLARSFKTLVGQTPSEYRAWAVSRASLATMLTATPPSRQEILIEAEVGFRAGAHS